MGYLTGYRSILLDADRTYKMAALCTPGHASVVTGASDAAAALEVLDDAKALYRYGEFYVFPLDAAIGYGAMPPAEPDFMAALQRAISDAVTPGMTIGVDTADEWVFAAVARLLDGCKVVNIRPLIQQSRATKLPAEIALLTKAANVIERGLLAAIAQVDGEATEQDLAATISREVVAGGGVAKAIVVAYGERGSRVDCYPTPQPIRKGGLIRFDLHASFDGYWADMARTVAVGQPTAEQSDRYAAILAGQQAQLDLAAPGVPAESLFHIAVDTVRKGALPHYQRNHCGHGIGLVSHEFPTVKAGNHTALAENMVFCFETPYYELGWGGMMVEDTTLITAAGNTRLTKTDRSLVTIDL